MDRSPQNILLYLWCGLNSGDNALCEAAIQQFQQSFPEGVEFDLIGGIEPGFLKKRFPVREALNFLNWHNPRNLFKTLKMLNRADLLVFGGGDLLNGSIHTMSFLALASLLRVPIIYYGIGVVPISNRFDARLTRWVTQRVDLITLRDRFAQENLVNLGVQHPKAYLTADPVFLFPQARPERGRILWESIGFPDTAPTVGFLFPTMGTMYQDRFTEDHYQALLQMAQHLAREQGWNVLFIPLEHRERAAFFPRELQTDHQIMDHLMKSLGHGDKIRLLEQEYDPTDLVDLMSNLEVVVSGKLHGLIFASLAGTPFLALAHAPKIRGVWEYFGLPPYCLLEVSELKLEKLLERFEAVWENRSALKALIADRLPILREKADINRQLAVQLLHAPVSGRWVRWVMLLPALIVSLSLYFYRTKSFLRRWGRKRWPTGN